ncbi:MAG: sulfotransferase domain-containing protein [Candidatus Helarchaeota archaeon]
MTKINFLKSKFKIFYYNYKFTRINKNSKIIISAGMPRSASTWLFNVIRILLNNYSNIDFDSGWISDINCSHKHDYLLIKTHHFNPIITKRAFIIFYSFRDIRDVLASKKRMFKIEPSFLEAKNLINADKKWKAMANYTMRYESMIESPNQEIKKIANILNIQNINIKKILDDLSTENYNSGISKNKHFNYKNLYHKNHITNGKYGTWNKQVDKKLIKNIEKKYSNWFIDNKYSLS